MNINLIYPYGLNNSDRGLSYELFYYVVVVHQSNEDSLIFPVQSVSVENDNKDQGIS